MWWGHDWHSSKLDKKEVHTKQERHQLKATNDCQVDVYRYISEFMLLFLTQSPRGTLGLGPSLASMYYIGNI